MSITEDLITLFNNNRGSERHPDIILEDLGDDLNTDVIKIDELFIEEHRWFNLYQYIYYVRPEKRWVAVDAEIASTENQQHESGRAYEVKPKEVVTTVYTTV